MPQADLVLVSVRRRTLPQDQLDALRAHVAAGKPLVGIRTASHAFSLRGPKNEVPAGGAIWPEFDAEVLGGHYFGHHGVGPPVKLAVAPGASEHALLNGVDVGALVGNGSLYKVVPLVASTTPLLSGSIPDQAAEPVAWTNSPRVGQSRVFYTSLGHPADFENKEFRKLLLHGICWAIGTAAPGHAP